MKNQTPVPISRTDYQPPNWTIDETHLVFELQPEDTLVSSTLHVRRLAAGVLQLDGDALQLESVSVNDKPLGQGDYSVTDTHLLIDSLPDSCRLKIVTRINPVANTALEGLYSTSGNFCTQCEAEGFRKITYYLDRPDVLSTFFVSIIAEQAAYPVLLSNGNLMASKQLDNGKHQTDWHDPFPKPCYLFALVAGDLARIEDTFTTRSNREVQLHIYVEEHNIDQCHFAMDALKRSMRWDEDVYGLEYDLDLFMIVAVDDFNAGAMENKGLNIFNSKYVLADKTLATDSDFLGVEAVIAHEYFHNWTGNRITCRDWFQLSLKEGLTVFRDQEFSSDMQSRDVKRIEDVKLLREMQFSEDASPMSHPIRPDQYIEINNFYTLTVYEKGAEVIRMIHTLLGAANYRKGIDLYFERFDGQAVTCDDFVQTMQDASGIDLSLFRRWYSQSGTPRIEISDSYNKDTQQYTLSVRQQNPDRKGVDRVPLHIPLRIGLLDASGHELPLPLGRNDANGSTVLDVTEQEQSFIIKNVGAKPTPSLLRGFSAPVHLDYHYHNEELAFLIANDTDSFNRWEAGQRYSTRIIEQLLVDKNASVPAEFAQAFYSIVSDKTLDAGFKAMVLQMPGIDTLANSQEQIDIQALDHATNRVSSALAGEYQAALTDLVQDNLHSKQPVSIAERRLANTALSLLTNLDGSVWFQLALDQYEAAGNMTDRVSALKAICKQPGAERDRCLGDFYDRWQQHKLVIDKWFSIQASAEHNDVTNEVIALTGHKAFDADNPNRFRSLVWAFASNNPVHFHSDTGDGYTLVADHIIRLNRTNPQVAARLVSPFLQWRRFVKPQQTLMQSALQRVSTVPDLSPDVFEVVSKALDG